MDKYESIMMNLRDCHDDLLNGEMTESKEDFILLCESIVMKWEYRTD